MDNRTLILLFTCFIPLFTAVVGTIIEAISLQDSVTVREKHVKRMLMCYFLMFIFIGTGVATGVALPKIAIQILPLTVFSLYIAPVLYYRFVYLLTNTENKETSHFSRHYLFPVLSALGFCAFFYIVPPAIRLQLVVERTVAGYPVTTFIFKTIPLVQFALAILYMSLVFRKLAICYRQNGPKSVLWKKWFHISVFLCSLTIIWSGAFCLTTCRQVAVAALSIAIVAAWIQAIHLCCHTFNRRSLLFLPLTIAPIPLKMPSREQLFEQRNGSGRHRTYTRWTQTGVPVKVEPAPLNRKLFEQQVIGRKLYLNPQLRLSDLMELFNTNRSYLSGFINETYGCGFNGYINRLRLREFERLMNLPSNRKKAATKLYARAGFPNYQTYLRIKKKVYNQES